MLTRRANSLRSLVSMSPSWLKTHVRERVPTTLKSRFFRWRKNARAPSKRWRTSKRICVRYASALTDVWAAVCTILTRSTRNSEQMAFQAIYSSHEHTSQAPV